MLYKKVHRQFVREFQVGRKYRFNDSNIVGEISGKPSIDKKEYGYIYILVGSLYLIYMTGPYSGKMWHKDDYITWLD